MVWHEQFLIERRLREKGCMLRRHNLSLTKQQREIGEKHERRRLRRHKSEFSTDEIDKFQKQVAKGKRKQRVQNA